MTTNTNNVPVATKVTKTTPFNVAVKSVNFMDNIKPMLEAFQISPVLFRDAIMFELANTPKLGECSYGSIIQALRSSAQCGLIAGKMGGKAYLIPYGKECQFQISYKGLIEILGRHKIRCRPVPIYSNDEYSDNLATDTITHFAKDMNNRGDFIGAYVVFTFADGFTQYHRMSKTEIDKIRDNYSQAYSYADKGKKDSPWHTAYQSMALKTVIKQGCKYIQVPYDVSQALIEDDRADIKKNAIETSFTHVAPEVNFAEVMEDDNTIDDTESKVVKDAQNMFDV